MQIARQTTDRRRIRGNESRQAIIEGAIDCIASRGLSGTTLDTVAERARVSRSLVLFHFQSKNRMHIEVLNYLGAQFSAGWDAILAEESVIASDKLHSLLEYDVRFVNEYPEYVSVWHAFWGEAKGNTLYREVSSPRDRRYMGDVRALLQCLTDTGDYDDVDPTAAIKGIEAMLFGFWLDAHVNPGPDQYAVAMRALRTYLSKLFPNHFIVD
jgi:TetR/AcrR family transcriptional repressor of bet genes